MSGTHKVKIVAPYNKEDTKYIQIRTFLSWKDSIAASVDKYGITCYYRDDGLIVETKSKYNYDQLLLIDNAQPYI